jgi:PHP family Zn ribbon phosphoesterase
MSRRCEILDPQLATLLEHGAVPDEIAEVVRKPAGARFYKCALQVNPFAYVARHAKQTVYKTEEEYNAAIVAACLEAGVEVVGITDHFRIATSQSLAQAFTDAGIHVLIGFEAASSEGVHVLCLFSGDTSAHELERKIGACGVTDHQAESPQSDKTCEQLLKIIPALGGITIAAHACSPSGILTTLRGQPRARVWTASDLLAVALPSARSAVPENCLDIMANKDPAYERPRPVAVVNANDVSDPDALADLSCTTWIKMTVPSIEGLRQAFLDWESRIRLNSDAKPTAHTELIGLAWAGGLLDGQSLRLNEGLNVLVGGRGAGKSTLIESVRFALELSPMGDEAKRTHEGMIKSVLGSGATVRILIRSPRPSPQYYLIERIFGSRARVRDQNGDLLQNVTPRSVLGMVEVYGQHEISELTRYPAKLAQLLRRFTEPATDKTVAKAQLKEDLERSRDEITSEVAEIGRIEEALAVLPTLREHLKRFAAAGLEVKLKDKTLIDHEKRLFEKADEMVKQAEALAEEVIAAGTLEGPIVGDDAKELPNGSIVAKLDTVHAKLLQKIKLAGENIEAAAKEAASTVVRITGRRRKHFTSRRSSS